MSELGHGADLPSAPPLAEREIHVWSAALDRPPVPLDRLRSCLSPEERARSARFVYEERSVRFDAAHGLMRWILAAYVGRAPEALEFSKGPEGKPSLERGDRSGPPLEFNVSDSADHFLIAVSGGAPVGADVERLRPVRSLARIASRFFAPAEARRLLSLPAEARERAFFECWTRKEAFVKAMGGGLTIPLDSFEVVFGPGADAAFRAVDGSEDEAARWSLWGFEVTPGVVGAVATRETGRSLLFVPWDGDPVVSRAVGRDSG